MIALEGYGLRFKPFKFLKRSKIGYFTPVTLPVMLATKEKNKIVTPSEVIYRDKKKLDSLISGFKAKYVKADEDTIKRCVSRYAIRPSPIGDFVVVDSIDVRKNINACIQRAIAKAIAKVEEKPVAVTPAPPSAPTVPTPPSAPTAPAPAPVQTAPMTTIVPEIPERVMIPEVPEEYVEYTPGMPRGIVVIEPLYKRPEFIERPEFIREEMPSEIPEIPSEIPSRISEMPSEVSERPYEIPETKMPEMPSEMSSEMSGYGQTESVLPMVLAIGFLGYVVYNIVKR
jgi:hypothetical protein